MPRQWNVDSKSSDRQYLVTLYEDGTYKCSCPKWIYKKLPKEDCDHIKDVQDGLYDPPTKEPEFVLCMNQQVEPVYSGDRIVKVRVPLLPLGRMYSHFQATLIYDCLRFGISWKTLKEKNYELCKHSSKASIIEYVEDLGRCIFGDYDYQTRRHGPLKTVPVLHSHDGPVFKTGDYWQAFDDADLFLFTANNVVQRHRRLVMGAGTARQVRDRFRGIDEEFGKLLIQRELTYNHSQKSAYHLLISPRWPLQKVGAFQTKYHHQKDSDLDLIQGSINALVAWTIAHPEASVHLPYPGIGKGQLGKELVAPLLKPLPPTVTVWEYK